MRLKSFIAPTVSDAMAQIRATLGDDAVIVATHHGDGGGVRVTAAVEQPDAPPFAAAAAHEPESAAPAASFVDIVYDGIRRHGVPAVIGEELLELVGGYETSDATTALAAALHKTFRFSPLSREVRSRPLFLVGPPGSGKTQTAAKLAARGLMDRRSVALFTTDTARTGGRARLAAFAGALKLSMLTADDPGTLADGLAGVEGFELTVIDSAGCNHLDGADLARLGRFLAFDGVEPLLILPAGLDPVDAGDIGLAFGELGVDRMVVSRIDLSRRLGSALAAAYAANLAFAETSDTPKIKDGLAPADPLALARLLLAPPHAAHSLKPTGTNR